MKTLTRTAVGTDEIHFAECPWCGDRYIHDPTLDWSKLHIFSQIQMLHMMQGWVDYHWNEARCISDAASDLLEDWTAQ